MEQFDLFGKSEIISELPKAPELKSGPKGERQFDTTSIEQQPLNQFESVTNCHELPAYTEFKQHLTPENPFINCQTTDDINELWNVEWNKIVEQTSALKNRKSELTGQLKQYKGRGKETAKLRAPTNTQISEVDAQIETLKEQESNLQLYQAAVSLRIVQKIVDNIFSFEPEFNLTETLEDCWEIDDYENYLLSVAIPKAKSL